jgi:ADP-ribosyl-[dinitrogen reductase] hydrolase
MYYAENPPDNSDSLCGGKLQDHACRSGVCGCCKLFAAFIVAALQGWSKEQMLEQTAFDEWLGNESLMPNIEDIRKGSYIINEPPYIKGSGYVVKSLEAALWAFAKSASFEEGALLAVNLGDDADTTGAVYGQLAGAYYGYKAIPTRWVKIGYERSDRRICGGII